MRSLEGNGFRLIDLKESVLLKAEGNVANPPAKLSAERKSRKSQILTSDLATALIYRKA